MKYILICLFLIGCSSKQEISTCESYNNFNMVCDYLGEALNSESSIYRENNGLYCIIQISSYSRYVRNESDIYDFAYGVFAQKSKIYRICRIKKDISTCEKEANFTNLEKSLVRKELL